MAIPGYQMCVRTARAIPRKGNTRGTWASGSQVLLSAHPPLSTEDSLSCLTPAAQILTGAGLRGPRRWGD